MMRVDRQEFLDQKSKRKWLEVGGKKHSLFIYPRSLFITWGHVPRYWDWNCFKETSEENIEVVKLVNVCWMDVQGALPLAELEARTTYELAFCVKLTKSASGWELPLEVRLRMPGQEQDRIRLLTLLDKPRGEWFEVSLGTLTTNASADTAGEVRFYLCQHGGHWKTGLVIRGVVFRPKEEAEESPPLNECCGCFNLKAAAAHQ